MPVPNIDPKHYIFVYGTLKKEGGNGAHERHLKDNPYMGVCCIPGALVHLGPYPGLVDDPDCYVTGEVYEVDAVDIHHLDQYESCPFLYSRRLVDTPWGKAWAYFKNNVPLPIQPNIVCVREGLWRGNGFDKSSYADLQLFYQNKEYLDPSYRERQGPKPILPDKVPNTATGEPAMVRNIHGMEGVWNSVMKRFEYPDGTTFTPTGTIAKGTDVLKAEGTVDLKANGFVREMTDTM